MKQDFGSLAPSSNTRRTRKERKVVHTLWIPLEVWQNVLESRQTKFKHVCELVDNIVLVRAQLNQTIAEEQDYVSQIRETMGPE